MSEIERYIFELKRNSDERGIYFNAPCTKEALEKLVRDGKAILQAVVPKDYLKLLTLTNGLTTQRGYLYGADDFIEQNYRLWFCDPTIESTSDGISIVFNDKKHKSIPTYAWIGCYGNLDSYIFDFASQQFVVTAFNDATEIWSSYSNIKELLLFFIGER